MRAVVITIECDQPQPYDDDQHIDFQPRGYLLRDIHVLRLFGPGTMMDQSSGGRGEAGHTAPSRDCNARLFPITTIENSMTGRLRPVRRKRRPQRKQLP